MLLLIVGVSGLDAYLAARRTEQQVEAQLERIARTLHDATFPLTDTVLQQMRGLSNADFVVADARGQPLAMSDAKFAELKSDVSLPPAEVFRLGPTIVIGEERYFHTIVGLKPAALSAGGRNLHVLYPERVWTERRWLAAVPSLTIGSVALSLVIGISVVIARQISRPIGQLKTQVSRLAQGEFQPIPVPSRDDELRELVLSVNSLAGQLDELRQVIQRTERLAVLGQLSGGLAHHLRNCVTGAQLAVQLHQRHCQGADQESLAVALRQLSLSDEQLRRFLAVGKPQPPQLAEISLNRLLAEVQTLIEMTCRHRKIDVRFDVPAEPLTIKADAEQLRQLLLNLLLNGIDAVGNNGWLRLEMRRDADKTIRVRVLDSGPGPTPEIAGRLFEPFATGKPEGVGLGLAVARQIAEAHGGSLRYERQDATCFELTLPPPGATPLT